MHLYIRMISCVCFCMCLYRHCTSFCPGLIVCVCLLACVCVSYGMCGSYMLCCGFVCFFLQPYYNTVSPLFSSTARLKLKGERTRRRVEFLIARRLLTSPFIAVSVRQTSQPDRSRFLFPSALCSFSSYGHNSHLGPCP